MCTGPGGVPSAAASIRPMAERHSPFSRSGSLAGAAVSARRTASPKIPDWTTVWFAPVPMSCGGRSAVSKQGHSRVRRLQHGRVQVRDRGTRRRHHRHRPPRAQGETQREEPGRALVDADVEAQPSRGVRCMEGERERCAARAGAEHGIGDSATHELVDEHLGMGRRRVHRAEAS